MRAVFHFGYLLLFSIGFVKRKSLDTVDKQHTETGEEFPPNRLAGRFRVRLDL
jgi:hypothetical protein